LRRHLSHSLARVRPLNVASHSVQARAVSGGTLPLMWSCLHLGEQYLDVSTRQATRGRYSRRQNSHSSVRHISQTGRVRAGTFIMRAAHLSHVLSQNPLLLGAAPTYLHTIAS